MIKACIDFGTNVKFMLLRDNLIVQFVTLDYRDSTQSELFALMNGKNIGEIVYCLQSHFSTNLLEESAALELTKLETCSGYFCVSLDDISKLIHLAHALMIPTVRCTERRFLCHQDGIYVFELDGIFQIYSVVNGRLISYDMVVAEMLNSAIQRNCIRYKAENIVNLMNYADFPLLCEVFENVSSVDDSDTLADLTYMAYLTHARTFDIETYKNSQHNNVSIVSDTDYSHENPAVENESDITSGQPEKNPVKQSHPGKMADEKDEISSKVQKHKSKMPIILTLLIALGVNGYFYYSQTQITKQRMESEAVFQQILQSVSTLKSKYTVLSAQSTAEAGAAAYSFLEAVGLTADREDIKLHSFSINGSTVRITVSMKNEDMFWDFYNEISETYNVSGVSDDTLEDGTAVHTVSMLL